MTTNYPDPYYFDYSASAPPDSIALERLKDVSVKYFANPSSLHKRGRDAKGFLLNLREQFCNLLNFSDGRLLICCSGTEANNTIIEGHLKKNPGGRILMAENVHDSVWYATKIHKDSVDILEIDKAGQINLNRFKEKLKPVTSLVCINHVCNETGAIQDINHISAICSNRNIRLLVDGVQALGHIPVDMDRIQCDYYSFSAHKFGGPRSFGGLFIRDDTFEPLLKGGKQEWSLRAGTENIGGLSASLVALEKSLLTLKDETERLNELRITLIGNLKKQIPDFLINSSENGKPGLISLSFPGFMGNEIVNALSIEGFSISTGSACHENTVEPSRIISAIGRKRNEAKGTIRISMGRGNTVSAVNDLSKAIVNFIKI